MGHALRKRVTAGTRRLDRQEGAVARSDADVQSAQARRVGLRQAAVASADRAASQPLRDAIRRAKSGKTLALPKTPVLDILKARGGVVRGSTLAQELQARGITPKTKPGLFRKARGDGAMFGAEARGAADNLVGSEHPVLSDNLPVDENGYVSEGDILSAIDDELSGNPPLGYDIVDRRLVVNEAERRLVLDVFEGFVRTRSATRLVRELRERGAVGKRWTSTRGNDIGGRLLDKGSVYRVLTNRVYLGEAVHKGQSYTGEHDAIVPEDLWARAQAIMTTSPRVRANATRRQTPAPLKGLMRCAHCEAAMSPTQTRKGGRLYRYYTCQTVLKVSRDACPVCSLPAGEVERAVLDQVRALALRPEIASRVSAQAHGQADAAVGATAAEREDRVRAALSRLDAIWDALFPDEQARLMALMIEGVHCAQDRIEVRLRVDGLAAVAHDLAPAARTEIAA